MLKLSILAAVLLFGITTSALATSATFVTVNGVRIPQRIANYLISEQKAQGAEDNAELRANVRETLIRRELLLQEARRAGTDKRPDVAAQADLARQTPIINAYLVEYMEKNPISEAQLRAEYEKIKLQIGTTEYRAKHILVEQEDRAIAIINNLKRGVKFENLAKESIDLGSKDDGGDLGWSSASAFVKPFGDALTRLAKGKYTETPVKTDFGYHVILLEDTRPLAAPAFEEVKPRLEQRMQSEQINKMIEGLLSRAKIQ